jgi:hypothetical protein
MAKRNSSSARPLTDHDEIRRWAEERGGRPSCVRGTGGADDVGMIRLDFPGYAGEDSIEVIGWDDWFQKFEEGNLALMVQDETAEGQRSNFNKLVGREAAEERSQGVPASRRAPRSEGSSKRAGSSSRVRAASRSARAQAASRSGRAQGSRRSSRSQGSRKGVSARSSRSQSKVTGRKAARSTTRTTGRSSRSKRSDRAA